MNTFDQAVRSDRTAEERSESEGMPEHRTKARDAAQWARTRPQRVARTLRRPSPDMLGMVLAAQLAVLAFVTLLGPRRI
jgi:hypothetical protein